MTYVSSPTRLDQLWGPHSLLFNEYRFFLPGIKLPGRDIHFHLVSNLEMSGAISLRPPTVCLLAADRYISAVLYVSASTIRPQTPQYQT
jgi:hypothetical protein